MLRSLCFSYWSLLFITLISSCLLSYIVATENAVYVTTMPISDASMAYDALGTSTSSAGRTSNLEQNSEIRPDPGAFQNSVTDDKNNENENIFNEDKNEKILPNYKKVKKFISKQKPTSAKSDSISSEESVSPPLTDGHILSLPSTLKSAEISEQIDNSIVYDDSGSSNSVENKNVFNTINIILNENKKIHSSIVKPIENNLPQQVPDMEQQDIQGIIEQHVQEDNADVSNDLPDITDIPTVTVTELPLEVLQQPQNTLNSVIIKDSGDRSKEDKLNHTIEVIADTEADIEKDDQFIKINDSGGGKSDEDTAATESFTADNQEVTLSTNNIPTDTINNISLTQSSINASVDQQQQQQQQQQQPQNISTIISGSPVNLTATEEVPMPVFSEWAQKQMEAAEKQQALEQEQTVNNSAQRKNNTNANGKPTALKIRAKNYASPDCGAKIIASSAYTSNAGAVLSSSKDEYMLSLCGNRIWFVVELCEAIQAQKIDFANFELYSSSPQNFTVAVSKRFPTREWSNVGRFEAEDKRAVQSFDLHPHLFGKFVRVDINSHYSKEHFCTLSLFRVFGTSEFEAFETENHPNEDLDDFDDEYLLEQNTVKHAESNLFKSASDAVLSIVKKATEVLGKPANNLNQTYKTQPQSVVCRTPLYGLFSCSECHNSLIEKVNNILSCEFLQLNSLLSNKGIRNDLLNTRVCTKLYGIETKQTLTILKDIKKSFYINVLPNEYVGALCQLLARPQKLSKTPNKLLIDDAEQNNEATELPSNLTIDKKFGKDDLNLLHHPEKKLLKPEIATVNVEPSKLSTKNSPEVVATSTETNRDDKQQLPRPLEPKEQEPTETIDKSNLSDTNIFNVPADELSPETVVPVVVTETPTSAENFDQNAANTVQPLTTTSPVSASSIETITAPPKTEEDSNSWDNIEHLLTTVPSTITAGNTGLPAPYNSQKTSNGPQSESVFIRLSNRIKALERNMSLSGQYLEELSRRYKKQVEELQLSLTQQIQTIRTLEQENRHHHESEQSYAIRNTQLKGELDNLILQVNACIVVIIFVGAFVFFVLMVGILFYRSIRRQTKEVLLLHEKLSKKNANDDATVDTTNMQKKIDRRKSFEDFSDQQLVKRRIHDASNVTGRLCEKLRRPSEEAMLILTDSQSQQQQLQGETEQQEEDAIANQNHLSSTRQRKISVCYGSSNNINQSNNNQCSGLPPQHPQKLQNKRRDEKLSWPNTASAQLQAWQHLEELNNEDHIEEISSMRVRKPTVLNGKSKKKKEAQSLKRQHSSPTKSSTQHNSPAGTELKAAEFDERLILDEDDLDNFIPNNDLAYNEFMPDGPRGYQCANSLLNANEPASIKTSNKQLDNNSKKSRRLSSPVFFKSPFTKSLKGKISNSNKSNPPHESTSWEWYRLKKSTLSAPSSSDGGGVERPLSIPNSTNNTFLRVSPNASLDSSSLSEINFPTNSNENSFRILEEAILSSGECAIMPAQTASSNCKKLSGGFSSSSNSNRSSSSNSSTQSKKKSRSFNKIFRKVF